jgi:RNA polymerase sigma-70 factor (ECF subfamily)
MIVAELSKAISEADEDLALVRAAKDGRLAAFEQLVHKYQSIVLAVLQSILGNQEEAQNEMLEVLCAAYEKLSQFQENAKFSRWLLRIVVQESLSRLTLHLVDREPHLDLFYADPSESIPLNVTDWVSSPEEHYDTLELRDILSNSLRSLPPTARLIFVLRDIGGFSLGETADMLGLGGTTVRERLFQARLHLREKLARYFKKPHL